MPVRPRNSVPLWLLRCSIIAAVACDGRELQAHPIAGMRNTEDMAKRSRQLLALLCSALLVTGCGSTEPPGPRSSMLRPDPDESASAGSSTKPADASAADMRALKGATIALDPGHNGGNAKHLSQINKQVPDGNGGTKACNTTGTATWDGYEEHEFTWKVASAAKKRLEDAGAKVVMSRTNDRGVGPCVDKRGTFASDRGAQVLVSIHANGSESRSAKGFGVIVAPKGPEVKKSTQLGRDLSRSLQQQGFPINRAGYDKNGLTERTDLGGLMNAKVPAALIECGEMNNKDEAKAMKSVRGQQRYADAVVAGIGQWMAQQR